MAKVFYYLEKYEISMKFALRAKSLFDVNQKSEYTDTIVGKNLPYLLFNHRLKNKYFFFFLQQKQPSLLMNIPD